MNKKMLAKFQLLILFLITKYSNSEKNRLIRVDGINPTCFPRPKCKEFDVIGAVVSVDKSLPYMGSNYCCLTFNILRLNEFENEGKFMARILKSTVLQGLDYIAFYDSEFNLIKNITSNEEHDEEIDPYEIVYFDTPRVSVEVYKDRNYRSKYEIVFTTYYNPESSLCYKSSLFHRCVSTNKSICIDEELTCDKFEHCPNDSDEELCGPMNETTMIYDKMTITIVLSLLIGVIIMTIFLILLLCFFKSSTKLTQTFMSIFGYRSQLKNSNMLDVDLRTEQHCGLLDENGKAKLKYHV